MDRVWTLQEAVLAENMFFQFADGCFDIDAAYELSNTKITDSVINREPSELLEGMRAFYSFLPTLGPSKRHDVTGSSDGRSLKLFRRAWNHISYRSTSKLKDKCTILATLNYLNTRDLLGLEPSAKRIAFEGLQNLSPEERISAEIRNEEVENLQTEMRLKAILHS